jgi:uncharacterized protein (DUF2236 family)
VADFFPKDSVIRRVSLEPSLLLGAGRALLLQLADAAVAEGVQDHSGFKANPFQRLQGTLEAVYGAVFGSRELAEGIGRRLHWVHEFVVGPTYRANDPEHLFWVHATLVDTALRCYTRYVGTLPAEDEAAYYADQIRLAELFGVPRDRQPATMADFRAYMDERLRTIEVTDTGRDLIGFILDPTLPAGLHVPMAPMLGFQRLVTLGSLPVAVRDQLGVAWTGRDQARFDAAERRVRRLNRGTPRAVRTLGPQLWGQALIWQAERHVRQFDERRATAASRPAA